MRRAHAMRPYGWIDKMVTKGNDKKEKL